MSKITTLLTIVCIVAAVYFFSFQFQKGISSVLTSLSKKVGVFSANREHAIQRYVYLHRNSPISWLYYWVNEQLIASGLKRSGVTPVGYVLFWLFVSATIAVVASFLLDIPKILIVVIFCVLFCVFLVLTRVIVSEQMERREAEIMDALDLIIPELKNGVKRAIATYVDNFAPSIQGEFKIFLSNIQDRGYSFPDAMYILSDNLGLIFKDFAQKAINYEAQGDKEMLNIFDDITETNRQRRELRYINDVAFSTLKTSFIVSCAITIAYFVFLMATDAFSRYFFLTTNVGIVLLILIALTMFGVLAYISTIKSRAL